MREKGNTNKNFSDGINNLRGRQTAVKKSLFRKEEDRLEGVVRKEINKTPCLITPTDYTCPSCKCFIDESLRRGVHNLYTGKEIKGVHSLYCAACDILYLLR